MTHRFRAFDVRRYIAHLTHEIREAHDGARAPAETIYLGGGTPSILTPDQIGGLLSLFDISMGAEVTLECNPEDITETYLESLKTLGVNRLSIGIQSLNPSTLQKIGRGKLTPDEILERLQIARSVFDNLSVDLIIGLPYSTSEQVITDITTIQAQIAPPHMSLYLLEEGVYPSDWSEISMTSEEQAECYIRASEELIRYDLHRYEVSNFAQAGYESKHNQNYWTHKGYYGYGLSAASLIGDTRSTWSESFAGYYRGEKKSEKLSQKDKEIESMIFAFRQNRLSDLSLGREQLISLTEQGYIEQIADGEISLTSAGILAENHILSELWS